MEQSSVGGDDNRNMGSDIRELLTALADWRKAGDRLKRATPDRPTAEEAFNQAQNRVMEILQRKSVALDLDRLIQQAHITGTEPTTRQEELRQDRDTIATTEIETARPLNLSQKEVGQLIISYLKARFTEEMPSSSVDLLEAFLQLSDAISRQYGEVRAIPRKEKKQRKRRIATGVTFTVVGLGLLAGNTRADPANSVYSYVLGGNALLQAIRDLIGEGADL